VESAAPSRAAARGPACRSRFWRTGATDCAVPAERWQPPAAERSPCRATSLIQRPWKPARRRWRRPSGRPTSGSTHTTWGNKLAPWLAERYIARIGVDSQQTYGHTGDRVPLASTDAGSRSGMSAQSKEPPPDQQTAHESVRDEADVGRFSEGVEQRPQTRRKLHRGRFSEGMEELPQTPRKRHPGRFSEGVERVPETQRKLHRGSFAEGMHPTPDA
jgi:hypothetical protein